ncbi:MAG: MarR family transcriptional regulator [Anaeromyxobacter sp.]|nr:MarR family transcriptional regulator [Anaeromyxobacter sp.]MBL0275261.1 MarR family transcriptional regulator [Anaeromyxobacter sp.]
MRTISRPARPARPAAPPAAAGPGADGRRLHGLLVELMRRRSLRDPIAATCAELDLSAPQVHALLALGHDGPLAMGDLARRVAVTEKTVTGLIDRLERDGLCARARDAEDRRVVHVGLTPRGAALHRRMDAEVLERLTGLLGRLDAADRRDLFRIIHKLTHEVEDT